MSASLSNYLANGVLNAAALGTTFTFTGSLYVAFYTTNPTAADTGTEVTGYTRPLFDCGTTPITGRVLSNVGNILVSDFPSVTGVTYIGLRDAAVAGNLLVFKAITSINFVAGTIYRWGAGQLTFDMSA